MVIHSSILAWKIPWAEEPGELQSKGSQRVRHNWGTKRARTHTEYEKTSKFICNWWNTNKNHYGIYCQRNNWWNSWIIIRMHEDMDQDQLILLGAEVWNRKQNIRHHVANLIIQSNSSTPKECAQNYAHK